MSTDRFAHKAATYDDNAGRVDNVAQIAAAIRASVDLRADHHIVDFGSGTGLLLERLADLVGAITAVDVSASMTEQLRAKLDRLPCPVHIEQVDLTTTTIGGAFDGIVSSMTMHHISDTAALLERFHSMIPDGGFIALADLESEDGSFHREDTGVHHHGFRLGQLDAEAEAAGFSDVRSETVTVMERDGKQFPVFLLTARR